MWRRREQAVFEDLMLGVLKKTNLIEKRDAQALSTEAFVVLQLHARVLRGSEKLAEQRKALYLRSIRNELCVCV